MDDKPAPYKGATVINGFKWSPLTNETTPDGVRNFNVRDDDVFVVTYPKSGTNWSYEILKNIFCDGDTEKIKEEFKTRIRPMHLEFFDMYKKCDEFPTNKRRLMTTHCPANFLPKQIFEGKGKAVIIMRNPKDTAVSFWHFLRERRVLEEYDQWESFFQAFLKPDMLFGNWFDYHLSYYEHKEKKNLLFVTYEEMKLDPKGAVIQLSDFISHPLTEDQVNLVVQNTTFDNMKKIHTGVIRDEKVLKALSEKTNTSVLKEEKFTLMRKGIVGDWKTGFTVAQNELFDQVYYERMKQSPLKNRMIFEL